MEENQLIYNDLDEGISKATSLARFLKGFTRLDKRLLGDFISRPENSDILKAFIELFDFRNVSHWVSACRYTTHAAQKPISDAMRELLESFRLPGEAQQIARITETFAEVYFSSTPGLHLSKQMVSRADGNLEHVKSQDAVYVLAYSVIMLNTDLHNPQNRVREFASDF